VILAAQANRPHLMDMTLPQNHPMRRQGPNGPPIPPYDIAGWTLTLQMGVTALPITVKPAPDLLGALSAPVTKEILPPAPIATLAVAPAGGAYLLPTERNSSFTAVNRLLAAVFPSVAGRRRRASTEPIGRRGPSRSRRPRRPVKRSPLSPLICVCR
jgi:hypothetical protein